MRRIVLLGALVMGASLAGCGGGGDKAPEPAETAAIVLQPIGAPEMERYEIYGAGCAFVPKGGGIGSLFLADGQAAYIKTGGEVVKLAPDEGSAELPYTARAAYSGGGYSAALAVFGEGDVRGEEVIDYPGRFTLRDAKGTTLYDAEGLVECGA